MSAETNQARVDAPRVRFAPSPTGYLHVGGARTALFNWLFARATGGTFVLRIEDTDRDRSTGAMTEAILEGMRWLGLDWDEGPLHQADGLERHRADVARLLAEEKAYPCFCTAEELQAARAAAEAEAGFGAFRYDRRCLAIPEQERQRRIETGAPHTIRFQVPEGETAWDDLVHGPTRFQNRDIEDFIILRSDGTPIYNLAVVSDDVAMRISHVLRGDDHLSNTPKQLLLYRALGAAEPRFAHVPMILGADGRRLSKRHGATAVGEYEGLGILPEALLNFIALLGWNPGDDREIMEMPELIERFSIDRILKKSSVFDPEKLEWMNGQYLQRTPPARIVDLLAPRLLAEGLTTLEDLRQRADWFTAIADVVKARGRTIPALVEEVRLFLVDGVSFDAASSDRVWKDPAEAVARLGILRDRIGTLDTWEPASIEAGLRLLAEGSGVGFGKLAQSLRLALTGTLASPPIDQVVWLLGRNTALRRIDAARDHLQARLAGETP